MQNEPRVYVAGAMNSVGGNFNFPLFDYVTARLRAAGCFVYSPAEHARETIGPLEEIQKLDKERMKLVRRNMIKTEIVWIIDNADMVIMLPGWERSSGATAERAVALAIDIPVRETPGHVLLMDEERDTQELGALALDATKETV